MPDSATTLRSRLMAEVLADVLLSGMDPVVESVMEPCSHPLAARHMEPEDNGIIITAYRHRCGRCRQVVRRTEYSAEHGDFFEVPA